MKGGRSYTIALISGLYLIVCLFVIIFPAVTGHENAAPGSDKEARLIVMWNDEWMEDDPLTSATDEEVIFNYDVIRERMYYLGDDIANIQIDVWLDDTDDLANAVATLQQASASPVSIVDGTDSPTGIWTGGTTETFDFTFDIGTSGQVEMTYPLILTIDYDDITTGMNNMQDTFDLEIYISSIFDNNADDTERDEHDDFPHIYDFDGTPEFEEGETYQKGGFELTNNANFSISDVKADPYYPYSSNISFIYNNGGAEPPGPISAYGGFLNLSWNFTVDPDAGPGYYSSNIDIRYTRDDTSVIIYEEDLPSGLYVAPSTKVTGPVGGPTNAAEVSITYNMTGTPPDVDLYYTTNTSEPYDWVFIGTDLTPDGFYKLLLSEDGFYSWLAVSENETVPNSSTAPEASYYQFDITPPDLTGTYPEHASVNVTTNQDILFSFSEPMNTTSFTFTLSPHEHIWWSNWEDGDTDFSFRTLSFGSGLRYWINITTATDLAGNNLNSLPYSFYIDIVNSSAIASGPVEDLTNNEWITIRYSTTNSPQFVDFYYSTNISAPYSWTFIGWDNSVDGRHNWHVPRDGSYGWYAVSPNEAAPTNSDPPQASYYVYDGTSPQVINSIPIDNADDFHVNDEVRITFSEPMARWSVENSFMITPFRDTRFRWDNTTLIITFLDDFEEGTEPLEAGREYTITIGTEARDEAGNHLDEPFILAFTPKEKPIDSSIILWTIIIEIIAVVIIVLLLLMRKRKRREVPKGPADPEINIKEDVIHKGPEGETMGAKDGDFG